MWYIVTTMGAVTTVPEEQVNLYLTNVHGLQLSDVAKRAVRGALQRGLIPEYKAASGDRLRWRDEE